MMARYLPLLRQRGTRVKFHVKPALGPLLKGWDGADEVTIHGEDIGAYDFYAWVFDLPFAFDTRLETVPAHIPYLPAPVPDENTRLDPELSELPRIGFYGRDRRSNVFIKANTAFHARTLVRAKNFRFLQPHPRQTDGRRRIARPLPAYRSCAATTPFRRSCRLRHANGFGHQLRQRTAASGGRIGQGNLDALAVFLRLALAHGTNRQSMVSDHASFRQNKSGDWDEVIARIAEALRAWRAERYRSDGPPRAWQE